MATHVKRAFRYRFYPTDVQAAELSRTFGRVREVYDMALAARTEAWTRQERVNYNQTSAMLTAWKKAEELAYLDEVSCVPLQQALRDIVWSRPLPEGAVPSTVTVSRDSAGRWFVSLLCEDPRVKIHARIADRRRDVPHKLTTRLVRENQTLVIEDLTVRTVVTNRSLARAICDAAWSQFRSMLEYKAGWYGREVIAMDRFFSRGTVHDRDVNAANSLLAAGLAVSVCGAGVRPQRSTPGGQSAMKQKTPRREP
ncbi:IS200/IS605 family accessory protein TnpB-related protein [Streptomyces sp. DG1A-41]|uniref:RNA-guided endonuclease InsQ/TnpB family protein n=1 Tax=Streptomyces sp. DG1A-41 TaxID=3125779 RepID=UPI0030D1D8A8